MKNPNFIFLTLLILNISAIAQNWNVFNTTYRYNYKYDNSQLVSQVLFADSVNSATTFTINHLNRIGVQCKGSCPTITTALNQTLAIIVPNMPQFLQRKIIQYNNGFVVLRDTATLVLLPNCQPGQTWVFDSINTKNATCVSKSLQTIFGQPDSVKLIIVDGTDTLKLSKVFGILQFPKLYNQNKYYRLVGIENAASYDLTSLYGEKVPNAWDFYNFDVGDKFCYNQSKVFTSLQYQYWCKSGNFTMLNKTISNDSYVYTVQENWDSCGGHHTYVDSEFQSGSNTVRTYTGLSTPMYENTMYPGKVIGSSFKLNAGAEYNIARFGRNQNGIFFKYTGIGCSDTVIPGGLLSFIPQTATSWGYQPTPNYLTPAYVLLSEVYGVGLGLFAKKYWSSLWGGQQDYCQTCAVKAGSLYHGAETFVSVKEETYEAVSFKLYPNPNSGKFNLSIAKTAANEVRVTSVLGQTILNLKQNLSEQNLELDLGNQSTGIYFVQLLKDGSLLKTVKIIRN
ncbi:hypothetical protein CNR22_11425 [Sphingobacteriaceae bacterium]|nr:hypothetical protein CNR22_11425 [Sphingobacteriaceae bacterium]